MIKKLLILSLLFLYSCSGYEPVYSKKTNYKFNSIEQVGEKRLNQIIYRNIKSLENPDAENIQLLSLKINTQKIKKIHSKDTKGNPNKYKMEIVTTLYTDLNNDSIYKKDFIVSEVYDDFDSQFELNKYEKKILGIMTERLSEKIIIYLRTLK
tara:strand:+ start:1800 stop:2258 length:459 start_codon:yes stop_codon:yes gene_type:complete